MRTRSVGSCQEGAVRKAQYCKESATKSVRRAQENGLELKVKSDLEMMSGDVLESVQGLFDHL